MNPNNGIFSSADANFTRATTQFVEAGGTVLGYVYTRYGKGSRSIADIKANIDKYLQFYGRERISGIFLDEMASETSKLDFYREIYRYIKGIDPSLRVVGNPGLIPTAGYAGIADTLVSFEGTAADYAKYDPRTQNAWLYTYTNRTQAMLTHNTATCSAMQGAVQAAASARNNAGWVYATDIGRDGMLSGINVEATVKLAQALTIPVIASGGLGSMQDIENLCAVEDEGVEGVICGRAIYSGDLDFAAAQARADALNG